MNRFICCLFLLGLNVAAISQKQYFVYIQAEDPQPFVVKINEKVYSADAVGYLVLPKLKDTSYILKMTFPQNKWPEQQFLVNLRSKDHGFLLKNFDGKGWGLFDLQALSVIMSDDPAKDKATKPGADISGFTAILSRAANDPSLLETPVALVKYDEKPVIPESAINRETVAATKKQPANSTVPSDQPAKKMDSSMFVKKQPEKNEDAAKLKEQEKKGEQSLVKNTVDSNRKTDTRALVEQSINREEATLATKTAEANRPANSTVPVEQQPKKRDTVSLVKKEPLKNEDSLIIAKQQNRAEKQEAKNTGVVKSKVDSSVTVERSVKKEEPVVVDRNSTKKKIAGQEVESPGVYKRSVVTKKSESSTSEGMGLVYIDDLEFGRRDTIQIIIPNPPNLANLFRQVDEQAVPQKMLVKEDGDKDVAMIGSAHVTKRACPSIASDNDFLKLRKRMAAQRTDNAMISESKKVFKTKCFTTEHVKNLGNLFLNESGKFQFYETAYPFNSDRNNFATLQVELKDAYFIHRFKKMLN